MILGIVLLVLLAVWVLPALAMRVWWKVPVRYGLAWPAFLVLLAFDSFRIQ